MRILALVSLLVALPAAHAYQGVDACMMLNRHKSQLETLSQRMTALKPPAPLREARTYTCRLIPGYGCLARTQRAVPVTIAAAPGAAAAPIDFAEGFPIANATAHFFYLHTRVALTAAGGLVDQKTGAAKGYVREDHGRLYALLTEPFTRKISITDDPTIVNFNGGAPERVLRGYVCLPDGWFE